MALAVPSLCAVLPHSALPAVSGRFFAGRSLAGLPASLNSAARRLSSSIAVRRVCATAHRVEIAFKGETKILMVEEDESILSAANDAGLDLPHDCKLGVCMTCPAKVEAGQVDQSEGMLSDDVQEQGYALMCASYPRSDCRIRVIPEEELLSLQLVTSQH